MKRIALCLTLSLLTAATVLPAQTSSASDSSQSAAPAGATPASPSRSTRKKAIYAPPAPFTHLALSAGISLMGINMQAATNVNPHLNLRAVGNYFTYSVNNIKVDANNGSNGIDVSGKLNFASMGVSLDYYPFPNHGWRLSPGVMLYNQNGISATGQSTAGTSITLNSDKYYSDSVDPFAVNASLGLNTRKQAFTMTTGWGNMISRRGGHWSFPFELGAVFTGVPTVVLNFTGNGCTVQSDTTSNGQSCGPMSTLAQADIVSQVAKYQKDLNPLQVYPILSFGVAYNFGIR